MKTFKFILIWVELMVIILAIMFGSVAIENYKWMIAFLIFASTAFYCFISQIQNRIKFFATYVRAYMIYHNA
jgi:hypothetical protein